MERDPRCRGSDVCNCNFPVVVAGFGGQELRQELLSEELVCSEDSPIAGALLFEREEGFAQGGLLGVEAGDGGLVRSFSF